MDQCTETSDQSRDHYAQDLQSCRLKYTATSTNLAAA